MYGSNPIRKQVLRDDGALYVSGIFATIQGEGPLTGTPAIFIRLSGCNLQCEFCDTDFETVRELRTVAQIMSRVFVHHKVSGGNIGLIVITGGEPFLQNIVPLIYALHDFGFKIQIETAGTVSIDHFPWAKVIIVISPKTGKVNNQFYLMVKDWKYIISKENTEFSLDGLPIDVAEPPKDVTVWLQPMDSSDIFEECINRDLCIEFALKYGHRISLQTHKMLGVE